MRPVMLSDVRAVARALLAVPDDARPALCARIIAKADAADRYCRRLDRIHPKWGNGTLLAAAQSGPVAREPVAGDPAYCEAVCLVFEALRRRHGGRTCKKNLHQDTIIQLNAGLQFGY